jgi:hypothetical protein
MTRVERGDDRAHEPSTDDADFFYFIHKHFPQSTGLAIGILATPVVMNARYFIFPFWAVLYRDRPQRPSSDQ